MLQRCGSLCSTGWRQWVETDVADALRLAAPGALQGGLVDLLLCSQLSGHIPRPPKGGAAAEAGEGGFYSIFTDPRKVGVHRHRSASLLCRLCRCNGEHAVAVSWT